MTESIDFRYSRHLISCELVYLVVLSIFSAFNQVSSQVAYCSMAEPVNGRFDQPCYPVPGRVCKFNCFRLDGSSAIPYSSTRVMCTSSLQWSPAAYCDTSGSFIQPTGTTKQPEQTQFITPKPDAPIVTCPIINPPENGYTEGICVNGNVSDVCTFGCFPGYLITGVTSLICMGDRWDNDIPECRKSPCFATVNSVTGGQVDDITCLTNPRMGSNCTISCKTGYKSINSSEKMMSVCGETGWNPPLNKFCEMVTCGDITLTPFNNGIWSGKCTVGSPNEFCSFSCRDGYSLIGASLAVCQPDGQWQYRGSQPQCVPAETSTLPESTNDTSTAQSTPASGDSPDAQSTTSMTTEVSTEEPVTTPPTTSPEAPPSTATAATEAATSTGASANPPEPVSESNSIPESKRETSPVAPDGNGSSDQGEMSSTSPTADASAEQTSTSWDENWMFSMQSILLECKLKLLTTCERGFFWRNDWILINPYIDMKGRENIMNFFSWRYIYLKTNRLKNIEYVINLSAKSMILS